MMAVKEREDLNFRSGGERCAAWLYRPEGEGPHPCVVLAHGFAGTREARLWAFAERFREAGMVALVFDYRYFGDSEGEPRQLLSIASQLEDWRSALAFARSLEEVDGERVALWGTSFSGGHVVRSAVEDVGVAAVVSQAPYTTGVSALLAAGPREIARLTIGGVLDGLAAITGGEPMRIPAVAPPGRRGAMSQPGAFAGYTSLYEDPRRFRNEVCARVLLGLALYNPALAAPKLRCPLLVCVVGGDDITPAAPALRMADRAPLGESVDYGLEWGHFDIYLGELFERVVADQTDFLTRILMPVEAIAAV